MKHEVSTILNLEKCLVLTKWPALHDVIVFYMLSFTFDKYACEKNLFEGL